MAAHLIRNSLDVVIDKDQLNIATHVAILRYFTSIVLSIAFLAIRVLQKDARLVIYTENFFFFFFLTFVTCIILHFVEYLI